jgi:hypothetical protein
LAAKVTSGSPSSIGGPETEFWLLKSVVEIVSVVLQDGPEWSSEDRHCLAAANKKAATLAQHQAEQCHSMCTVDKGQRWLQKRTGLQTT